MPVDHNHYIFNPALPGGARLRSGLNQLELGRELLIKELAEMTADLTGDGSSEDHFGNVTARYGFVNNTYSKAAYVELNSGLSKITTDESVTFVQTALLQLFTKLR